jgi:excinuclease ABC subunit C
MSTFEGSVFARSLTTGPGVYLMKDEQGKVLYVGKARNLRRRVGSYFDRRDKGSRINMMVRKTAAMEVSLTRTEAEALLLENEWIKAFRPRFNINLRDDKSYPWIRLDTTHRFPRIAFYRGSRKAPGEYFGPYSSAGAVRESLSEIYRLFGLRQCRDSVFSNRSRPCLQYQIGRCSAPCVGYVSEQDYACDVDAARRLLKGEDAAVIEYLAERMRQASSALEFEKAARLRDHIQSLQRVRSSQYVAGGTESLDVLGLCMKSGQAAVQVVEFRQGRNTGGRCFFPGNLHDELDEGAVIAAFIGQYYAERVPPAEILLSHAPSEAALWGEALGRKRSGKVLLKWRLRGQRAQWVKLAATNAEDALRRRQAERDHVGRGLDALAELIDLDGPPQRIECFDISHISGSETVGACVVFGPEGAMKKHYRHYNIQDVEPGDDYAAMDQALTRRYRRSLEQGDVLPDLILVDGGAGQLNRAQQALAELGLDALPLVGVAKGAARKAGHERLIVGDREVVPGPYHPASHLIQQIRDEAHRFAITGHRRRRQKRAQSSPLEQIPGVGPARRQSLLNHFGGLQGLTKAGPEDLMKVPGIHRSLAERIVAHLRTHSI